MEKLSHSFITSAPLILFIMPTRLNRQYPSRILRSPSRFLFFSAICGIGIVFAVLLLHLFHALLGWNLYLSNLLTIGMVTLWNFGMNARFNWQCAPMQSASDVGANWTKKGANEAGSLKAARLCSRVGLLNHKESEHE